MSWSIKVNGKETKSPILRVLAVIWIFVISSFTIVMTILLLPIIIPTHYVLRASGRRGFVSDQGGKLSFRIDANAFQSAN